MRLFLIRLGMFIGAVTATAALLSITEPSFQQKWGNLVMRLSGFGSLAFFFGPYLTESGFRYRCTYRSG